jgi:hypothetical protein
MSSTDEAGNVTGSQDKDYNLRWFTEVCLCRCVASGHLHPGRRPGR